MGEVDVKELGVPEYIKYIHSLPWLKFAEASFKRQGTGYVLVLHEKAVEVKAKTILELGVMTGESTRALLKAATENGGHLYSVELGDSNLSQVNEALKNGGFEDTSLWTFTCGDDLDVAKHWTKPVDFLFIDTSHTYEHTMSELEAYSKFVVQQGVIVMHDTYMNESMPELYPVKRAINDWMKLHGEWVFEDITPPNDGWGLGLLRRKQS